MTDALDVAGQLRPEVRVRDGYEGFAAFAQGFTVQVDDAKFGDDPVHVSARGDDPGAGIEFGYDAEDLPAHGPGRERDNRFAAGGSGGAADEVHLSADAGEYAVTDGVGADLAAEVDLKG